MRDFSITQNWRKIYNARIRIASHVLFWFVFGFLYHLNYARFVDRYIWVFLLKDLLAAITIFYSVPTSKIAAILTTWKAALLILWVMLAYFWWASITYLTCMFYYKYLGPPWFRIERYLDYMLSNGFLAMFWKNLPVVVLDFFFLMCAPMAAKLMKALMHQNIERTRLERDNLKLELDFLKSQVNPHFLFNTLNNIYTMVDFDHEKGKEMIMRLSELMRYTLYESKMEYILLTKEVAFIGDFIGLMGMRYDEKVIIRSEIAEIKEPYKIIPLLLIPFVENAFKHGPDKNQFKAYVHIKLDVVDDTLHFLVENSTGSDKQDGHFKSGNEKNTGGIGLKNINRRLEIYYKGLHELKVEETEGTYKVNLTIYIK